MCKILLTGSAGFIGSKLFKALEKSGHEVNGYDLVDGNDTRDLFELDDKFLKGHYDAVIHLAAFAGTIRGNEFPNEYISTNIGGTNNIVNLCKKYKVKHLIHFSSSSVVDCDDNEGKRENHEYKPVNIYGITKVAGELIIKNSGVNYVIIRPFTVYGEGGRRDMGIYKWIEQVKRGETLTIYGKGDSSRGYTYVDDIVDSVESLLNIMVDGHPDILVNIGGSEIVTINELFGMFKKHCDNNKIPFKYDYVPRLSSDAKHSSADTTLAKALFGYKPEKRFKKVIKKILNKELK